MTFDDLKFVRLTMPEQFALIPRYLFEQVKNASYKIERLYQFAPVAMMSPLTFMYALADKNTSIIKGVLWAEINPFSEKLQVFILSVDKQYQQKDGLFVKGSQILSKTLEFLRKIQKQTGTTGTIEMLTYLPKAYEKAGWKRSDKILMEL